MGIKQQLKQILPPTGRAFSARIDQIEQAVASNSSRLQSLQTSLADAHWAINETKAKEDFDKQSDRYTNPEISALPPRNPGQKRILLAGWYGAENLGDELMMQTVVEHIPDEQRKNTWIMLWDNFTYPVMELDPLVNVIHYPRSLWELRAYADAFDILIWGGGAIIDDKQYSNDPLNINTGNLFIHLSKLMESRGKQVLGLGLSTNATITDNAFKQAFKDVANKSQHLYLRDDKSLLVAQSCGICPDAISLCEDLVFSNSQLIRSRANNCVQENEYEPGCACDSAASLSIAFIALCIDSMRDHYIKVLMDLTEKLGDWMPSYRIDLIPFSNLNNDDAAFYQSIVNELHNRGVDIEQLIVKQYANDIDGLELTSYDFYIAYKYHAALLANAFGIPGLTICPITHRHYPNKMQHLADMCNYKNNLIDSNVFESAPGIFTIEAIKKDELPCVEDSLLFNTDSWLYQVLTKALCPLH